MTRRLIIDGNAVYEIDEDCMLKNRVDDAGPGKESKEAGCKYRQKNVQKNTAGHGGRS